MRKIRLIALLTVCSVSLFAYIKNPDKPLKGNWDFQIQKIWDVENAGQDVIGEVHNIAVSADERTYIEDSKNFKIYIFSKEGKFISSFGNKGAGPGEILKYGDGKQLFIVKGTVLFSDVNKIHYFSLEGKYNKTVSLPAGLKPDEFVSEDVFFSVPYTLNDPDKKEAKIILYNIKEGSQKVISKFFPFENASKSKRIGTRQRMTVVIEAPNLIPRMMLAFRNSKVIYGMSDSYRINVLDLKGKENISFGVEGRKLADFPEDLKKELPKMLASVPPDMVKQIIDSLPEKITFFQHISVDRNGLIYVFVSAPEETNIQTLDIFSPGGKYLYTSKLKIAEGLSIKPDFIYFKDDILILVAEDNEGTPKVIKYSLKLPVL
jgi:hypothetical protein